MENGQPKYRGNRVEYDENLHHDWYTFPFGQMFWNHYNYRIITDWCYANMTDSWSIDRTEDHILKIRIFSDVDATLYKLIAPDYEK